MQDSPEHVSCDRSDFLRVLGLCKSMLNGVNDLLFFFGTEKVIKATQKGDVPERHGPSHFLNQKNVRLPLQERAQVFCHTFSSIPSAQITDFVFNNIVTQTTFDLSV
jgi:hypothetical protein